MTSTENLARRLERQRRDIQAVATQPRLGRSSIDSGALEVRDAYGNVTGIFGQQFDGTSTAASVGGSWPTSPTMPMVTPVEAGLRIYWDGTYVDGSLTRMDFKRVTFHAVTDVDDLDILNPGQIVGEIATATGGEISVSLPMGVEHFIFAVAWTEAGKFSVESDPAFGTPLFVVGQEVLDELNQALEYNSDSINTLTTVTLPGLETEMGYNSAALQTLNEVTLPALETELGYNSDAINTLSAVTLPALETQLGDNSAAINELQTVALPALETELGYNSDAINTLSTVTLPAIQTELGYNSDIVNELQTVTLPVLLDEVDEIGQSLDTLEGVTIPALQDDLTEADTRLTAATASITLDLSGLSDEVALLTANTDESLGEVSDIVSIINKSTRSHHGIY